MSVMLFLLHSLNYKLNKINNSINNILIFQLSIVIIYVEYKVGKATFTNSRS